VTPSAQIRPVPRGSRAIRLVKGFAVFAAILVPVTGIVGGRAIGAGVVAAGIVLASFGAIVMFDVDGVADRLRRENHRAFFPNVPWSPAEHAARLPGWKFGLGLIVILQGVALSIAGFLMLMGVF
jgi:hypothetical protein